MLILFIYYLLILLINTSIRFHQLNDYLSSECSCDIVESRVACFPVTVMSWQPTSGTDMWLYIRDCWEILSSHRSLLELERPPPTNSKYAVPDAPIEFEEQWNRSYACACIVLQCDWPQCFLLSLAVKIDNISINQLGVSMICNPFSTLSTVILLLSI